MDANPDGVDELLRYVGEGKVNFVYSSKEQEINNAVALKEYVEILRGS
jgi:uncharacterized protein YeaO (DUF488 family)